MRVIKRQRKNQQKGKILHGRTEERKSLWGFKEIGNK